MNSRRNLLILALAFVSYLLYTQWQIDYNQPKQPVTATQTTQSSSSDVPTSSAHNSANDILDSQQRGKLITLESDVLKIQVDTTGGDVVSSSLLKYDETLHSKQPFALMQDTKDKLYIAQSGLIGKNGIDSINGRADYSVTGSDFKLAEGQNELQVPLTYVKDGVTYQKIFTLKRNSYDVGVEYKITNNSAATIQVEPYAQLKHTLLDSSSSLTMPTYMGGAYSSSETKYHKYSFSDMKDKSLNVETKPGWVAILQHYFVSAWVPNQNVDNHFYTRATKDNATIGLREPVVSIAPGATDTIKLQLWTGPKLQDQMSKVQDNLELTVDYGWAWFIAKPLFILLKFIHSIVGNWGLAIIGITIVVKAILYPLTRAQYTSMAKMRMLQPRITELRERFGDDKQRMGQETMKLYKEEKVNPLGGCLPILLQMPIFLALYYTFIEAVQLRHAPFYGWIHDLAAPDPYYILPILMGISMFFLQKFSPTPVADPMQQKIMTFMPVAFTVFFLWFPSGLVLYWLSSNLITITQQQIIYRGLEKRGLHSRVKKKDKKSK